MGRATRIAFKARLYQALANRPELLTTNREELIERMLAAQVAIGEFDRTLILHASELDRLCAHAVRLLTHRAPAAVLDALGVLSPDRVAAIYYALPKKRRRVLRRDPAWAYHIGHVPPETERAVDEIQQLAESLRQEMLTRTAAGANDPALQGSREDMEAMERALLRQEAGL